MLKRVSGVMLMFSLLVGGCTTQAVGARCEANDDCNTATDTCRSEVDRTSPCSAHNCICCPVDRAAAQAIPACAPATSPTPRDAGSD